MSCSQGDPVQSSCPSFAVELAAFAAVEEIDDPKTEKGVSIFITNTIHYVYGASSM